MNISVGFKEIVFKLKYLKLIQLQPIKEKRLGFLLGTCGSTASKEQDNLLLRLVFTSDGVTACSSFCPFLTMSTTVKIQSYNIKLQRIIMVSFFLSNNVFVV